jgi:hypothetical protein
MLPDTNIRSTTCPATPNESRTTMKDSRAFGLTPICVALVVLTGACQRPPGDASRSAQGAGESATTATPGAGTTTATADAWIDTLLAVIAQQRMTTLTAECLSFEADPDSMPLSYAVREKHSTACGGDPETAPRLFSIAIDTMTGAVSSDALTNDGSLRTVRPARGTPRNAPVKKAF